ncbi:hypothetical protein QUB34_30975 [Microcoleus sp. AT9b-C5]
MDPGHISASVELPRYARLDKAACELIDPKCSWRFAWANQAVNDGLKRTDASARQWIAQTEGLGERPSPRSLLRWMKKLTDAGGRIGALVSCAGREAGQSQLPDVVDRIVQKWAIAYWRPSAEFGYIETKDAAAGLMFLEWAELKRRNIPFLGAEPPSAETVRKRINSLECYSMYASRYGVDAAARKFLAKGEPVEAARPFERIYMDGTEYRHALFYSDEHRIPSAKLKGVMAMDCFSQFVFPFPVFAGPFRAEMGLRALRSVMTPPDLPEEIIKDDPELELMYGIPSDILLDRDRTLIAPGTIPQILAIVSTVELAEAYHSDAKSKLENFHKFVKGLIKHCPGQVLAPRDKFDPGYNPIKEARVTRAQYVDLIEQCRLQWNATAKESLGARSPNDLMRGYLADHGPRLTDRGEIWRALSRTPSQRSLLTNNGLEYEGIRYRWNRDGVNEILSSNYHKTAFSKRINGSAKVEVTIRVWDDDLDMIEVYDEQNRSYHRMYSTDPGYTAGLSLWEHHTYKQLRKAGGRGARTAKDTLIVKAKHGRQRAEILTGVPFREREVPTALMEAEERRMAGRRSRDPLYGQMPELYVPTEVGARDREDLPAPPPQYAKGKEFRGPDAADDVRSDPIPGILSELGQDDPEQGNVSNRWEFEDLGEEPEEEL